jgi:hypothetical protein
VLATCRCAKAIKGAAQIFAHHYLPKAHSLRPRGGLSGGTNPIPRGDGLLAPVYGRFTEGFDTRDLKAAKALLEELTE